MDLLIKAALMGIVEGLTEFLPVSSTGHLIIAGQLLQFDESIGSRALGNTFEVFIQLGAILAVAVFFARDLIALIKRAPHDRAAQRLLLGIAIAFIPAAGIGFFFNDIIDAYLFNPFTVGIALVVGAVIIYLVEQNLHRLPPPVTSLDDVSVKQALGVGIAQVASLFPGMSRSASTIIGGMLAGLDRPTALRFSFYLSIPTMIIATLYRLAKDVNNINSEQAVAFGVGLVVSFVVAYLVVRWFLHYVSHHDLKLFAIYRLVLGVLMIVMYFPR